jgi:ATP-dependent Zn protease
VVGDPTLLPLLEAHNVMIEAASPPTHWLVYLLSEGLPFLLLVGFFLFMGRKATQGQSGLFRFGCSQAAAL